MAELPSDLWRARIDEEAAEVAAGTVPADEAFATELFPPSLLTATDATLVEAGVDVPELAARRGLGPHEITDAWREW